MPVNTIMIEFVLLLAKQAPISEETYQITEEGVLAVRKSQSAAEAFCQKHGIELAAWDCELPYKLVADTIGLELSKRIQREMRQDE